MGFVDLVGFFGFGLVACSWLGSGFRLSFPLVLVSWVGVG